MAPTRSVSREIQTETLPTADIYLLDARTGKDIVPPITHTGASSYDLALPVSPLSALTKLPLGKDYLDTIQSYAEQINEGLFGKADARRFPHPVWGGES